MKAPPRGRLQHAIGLGPRSRSPMTIGRFHPFRATPDLPVGDTVAWPGWVVFAAFMMMMNGFIQGIEGLMALVNDDYFAVSSRGLAVSVDYTTWGWVHLLLGLAIFASGLGVLAGNMAARIVGVVLAGINAIVALLFIEAAPVWGIILITVDI